MKAKKHAPDWWILFSVLALVAIGIIMVFSSSQYFAQYPPYNDTYYFLKKQAEFAALGILGMFVLSRVNYRIYYKLAWPAFIVSILLLGGLVVMILAGSGDETKGAVRWLELGGLRFQPSEVAKLSLILLLAKILTDREQFNKSFTKGFIPVIALIGLTCGLVFAQTALSMTIIIACTSFAMMYCAGINFAYLIGTVILGAGGVVGAIIMKPFRMQRIYAYLDPWSDPLGSGFQTVQSLLAIGSGGLSGVGLGAGGSKWYYLPERHTDFIFSVLAEETGFLGCLVVILLFGILVWRGLTIAVNMPDRFGSLLAFGITFMIGFQAFFNLGVVTGLLPATGITLPFISSGGTSLIICLFSAGILLNLSKYAELKR